MTSDPHHVVIAGDWHANVGWMKHVIQQVPVLLPNEENRIIIQLGDFAIWTTEEREKYLGLVTDELSLVDAQLWFLDGNHEDYDFLQSIMTPDRLVGGKYSLTNRIYYLPRSHQWNWHGAGWMALGGAVSVDKACRTEGVDWWPQEELSRGDVESATAQTGGPVEILLTHDCPSSVNLHLGRPPQWWNIADVARADAHRALLQEVVDELAPYHIIHGHYHQLYSQYVAMTHGKVSMTGLNMDGSSENYLVFDTVNKKWI
jgi:Calcineurin-like phosphoesterase